LKEKDGNEDHQKPDSERQISHFLSYIESREKGIIVKGGLLGEGGQRIREGGIRVGNGCVDMI
jgi:hypothetical protein